MNIHVLFLALPFILSSQLFACESPKKSDALAITKTISNRSSEAGSFESCLSHLDSGASSFDTSPKSSSPKRRDHDDSIIEQLKLVTQKTLSERSKNKQQQFSSIIENKLRELAAAIQEEIELSKKEVVQVILYYDSPCTAGTNRTVCSFEEIQANELALAQNRRHNFKKSLLDYCP